MDIEKHLRLTGSSKVSWKDAIVKTISEASKSIDYISNITGGRERDAVKSTFAAPKVSSSEPSGTSSASLKMTGSITRN